MKKKILVADDAKIISNIVDRAFRDEYEIIVAYNGREAIDIINNNIDDSIVGVLLDLNMPEVDGFAVLDYFKENNLFKRIPVCIITGDDAKDRIERAFNYDIIDVLTKPFTFDKVRGEVEKLINLNSIR